MHLSEKPWIKPNERLPDVGAWVAVLIKREKRYELTAGIVEGYGGEPIKVSIGNEMAYFFEHDGFSLVEGWKYGEE